MSTDLCIPNLCVLLVKLYGGCIIEDTAIYADWPAAPAYIPGLSQLGICDPLSHLARNMSRRRSSLSSDTAKVQQRGEDWAPYSILVLLLEVSALEGSCTLFI